MKNRSLLKAGLVAVLLMNLSPKELLAQTMTNQDGVAIAQEFEREGDEKEILLRMQNQLKELMQISIDEVEPATLATPDYDVVKKVLQAKMSESIVNYFEQLEVINKDITKTFSELIALKNYADKHELDKEGPLHGEYLKDLKLKIPALNTRVNKSYSKAIKDLTTLMGSQPIAVRKRRNQFKEKMYFNQTNMLFGLCQSRLCVQSLSAEIMNWNLFAQNFNNSVDFVNFNEGKITTSRDVRTTPFITMSLLDASNKMLELGLKKNKDYTVPGMIARHMINVVKVPGAIATAIAAAPVYLVEKPARLLQNMSTKTMKLELSLNSVETYDISKIKNSLYAQVDDISKNKNSAIYYAESEAAEVLRKVIIQAHDSAQARFNVNALDQFSNSELLDFMDKGILTYDLLMAKLSPNRLQTLSIDLSDEQRDMILIQNVLKDPSKINLMTQAQKIAILERDDVMIGAYLPHLEDEIERLIKKSEIIAQKYDDYLNTPETPVPAPGESSDFYESLYVADDGNISIYKPKMYGTSGNLVPLNASSSASAACSLLGYQNGGSVATYSGDYSQTAVIGNQGFETYRNYSSNTYNRGIDTLICFTKNLKISSRYEKIITNLDGTSLILKPTFSKINDTDIKFSAQSSGNSICSLYGFREVVGTPGSSGDLSIALVYSSRTSMSPNFYSSDTYNRGIDSIVCR